MDKDIVSGDEYAHITKRVPRGKKSAEVRALAGTYRVIHGRIEIPLPLSARLNPDGTENPHAPKTEYANMGDEVKLGNGDAARMLDAGVIEPLDAKPSKVGKVWSPPKIVRNFHF